MDLELQDRAFLITGGTDGLGLALARTLLDEGAQVAVCGRDLARLNHAQELLGDRALCFEADVTNATQLDEFIDTTRARFGRLDGAVNNAGRSAARAKAGRPATGRVLASGAGSPGRSSTCPGRHHRGSRTRDGPAVPSV